MVRLTIANYLNNHWFRQLMVPETTLLLWLIPVIIWESIWKGIALWKSGRNNQLDWFIAIFVLNTVGILPIIYLKFYQKKR